MTAVRRHRPLAAALLLALAAGLTVAVVALAGTGGDDPPAPVAVYPSPGSRYASSATQVSLRGASADALGAVTVTGSRGGVRAGRLRPHPDGQGASFLPAARFAAGERVTVRADGVALRGAVDGAVSFTVAGPPPASVAPRAPAEKRREGVQRFRSRPDLLPPRIAVERRGRVAPGRIFVAPKVGRSQQGPMILDGRGRTLWFRPRPDNLQPTDFRSQTYRGRPVITWWEGRQARGVGDGQALVLDQAYRTVATVRAGNGYRTDLHEFRLTDRGTALLAVYNPVPADLRRFGGPRAGRVWDNVVQEVDVETGLVLFEWHALDHVPLRDAYLPYDRRAKGTWDYFHINSVERQASGHLLMSARHTHAIYEVDGTTGALRWRLGGKRSDFRMGPGTRFAWQHDARRQRDGTITLFDNVLAQTVRGGRQSRAIQLDLDGRSARLVRSWRHRPPISAGTQGSAQVLPNGNVFVGWGGSNRFFTEFTRGGATVFDGQFVSPLAESYRALKLPWDGQPTTSPALAARRAGGGTTAWASWNGATRVARWRLLGGSARDRLRGLGGGPWTGFETRLRVPGAPAFVAVEAVDAGGRALGRSAVTRVDG